MKRHLPCEILVFTILLAPQALYTKDAYFFAIDSDFNIFQIDNECTYLRLKSGAAANIGVWQ